jgi:hypothetical protein
MMISIATFTVSIVPRARAQEPNMVIQRNNAALQGVRDSKLGPPMVVCLYPASAVKGVRFASNVSVAWA